MKKWMKYGQTHFFKPTLVPPAGGVASGGKNQFEALWGPEGPGVPWGPERPKMNC